MLDCPAKINTFTGGDVVLAREEVNHGGPARNNMRNRLAHGEPQKKHSNWVGKLIGDASWRFYGLDDKITAQDA
jgi:hypothetical protein